MLKPRKHILFLASWYPSRVLLDDGDFIKRHAQAIATKQRVTVLHAVKDPHLKNKFDVQTQTEKGVEEIIVYFRSSSFSPLNLVLLLQAFLYGLKQVDKVDLLHLQVTYPAGLVGVYMKHKWKIPLVLTEHWTVFSPENYQKEALYKRFFIRQILKRVDYLCAVSADLEKKIRTVFPIEKCQVIPNVVDLTAFSVLEKEETPIKTFLHLSHLGYAHKNIQGMLSVAKRLTDEGHPFLFEIGGNGDLSPIDRFIEQHHLGNNVKTFGRLQHHEVNARMNSANCFILFSNYENQPCVQIEAFACGVPVIASDVGGISEFFPTNFGYLVQKADEEELYRRMLDVMKGASFATKLEMNAYANKYFSVDTIATQYNHIYQQLLKD